MAPPHKKPKLEPSDTAATEAGLLRRPKFVLSSPKPADDVDDNDTWQSSGGVRREAADPPYEVHIIPPVRAGAKKRDSDIGDSKLIRRYESPYEDRLSFDYKIVTRRIKGQKAPLDWFGCKGYNALKSGGHRHKVGDVVSVSHIPEDSYDVADWIAQVVDIRGVAATEETSTFVYALVVWLYRPEHLPGKRKACHYEHEVMPSNYMQIIDGGAIGNHVDLVPTDRTPFSAGHSSRRPCDVPDREIERVIWRQTIDYRTERLSKVLSPCACGENVDFGKSPGIICEAPRCGTAQHEKCVISDTIRRHHFNRNAQANGTSDKEATGPASPTKASSIFGRLANAMNAYSKDDPAKEPEPSPADEVKPIKPLGAFEEDLYKAHFRNDIDRGQALVAIVTNTATQTTAEVAVTCLMCRESILE